MAPMLLTVEVYLDDEQMAIVERETAEVKGLAEVLGISLTWNNERTLISAIYTWLMDRRSAQSRMVDLTLGRNGNQYIATNITRAPLETTGGREQ